MKFGKLTAFTVKVLVVCLLSGGLAVLFNTARTKPLTFLELNNPRPPGVEEIDTAVLLQDFAADKYFIIDARSEMDFAMGHIPGAMSFPSGLEGDDFAAKAAMVSHNFPVLIYCDGLACGKSLIVAQKLLGMGFRYVLVYTEGIDGWLGAGMDLEVN